MLPALTIAAAILAWTIARGWLTRSMWPFYRPVALLLTWVVVADVSRTALRALVLAPARAIFGPLEPYVGAARVIFHIDQGLLLSWPAALVAAACAVFLRRSPWSVAIGWTGACGAIVALYPHLRDGQLLTAYAVISLICCALVWGIALSYGDAWIQHHVSLMLLTSGELMANLAYLLGDPVRDWGVARAAHTTAFSLVLCYQVAQIARYWRWRKI